MHYGADGWGLIDTMSCHHRRAGPTPVKTGLRGARQLFPTGLLNGLHIIINNHRAATAP